MYSHSACLCAFAVTIRVKTPYITLLPLQGVEHTMG